MKFFTDVVSRRKALAQMGVAGAFAAIVPITRAAESLETPKLPVFDARAFGAKGDGPADDTAAIQAAVDALLKARGGRLHFPGGRYRVLRSILFGSADRVCISGDSGATELLVCYGGELVGLLADDTGHRDRIFFQYASSWLDHKLELSPFQLPLKDGTIVRSNSNPILWKHWTWPSWPCSVHWPCPSEESPGGSKPWKHLLFFKKIL